MQTKLILIFAFAAANAAVAYTPLPQGQVLALYAVMAAAAAVPAMANAAPATKNSKRDLTEDEKDNGIPDFLDSFGNSIEDFGGDSFSSDCCNSVSTSCC